MLIVAAQPFGVGWIVERDHDGLLLYQWRFNDVPIVGATLAEFVMGNVSAHR